MESRRRRWWRGRTHPCSWVPVTRGRAEGGIWSWVGGALGSPGRAGMLACSAASVWSPHFGAWGLSFLEAHPDSGMSRWLLSFCLPSWPIHVVAGDPTNEAWLCRKNSHLCCTPCVPELCTQSHEAHGTLVGWALLTS